MSIYAEMSLPVTLADLQARATGAQAELLGLTDVPKLVLFRDRQRAQGTIVAAGTELGPAELASTWLGPGAPDPEVDADDETGQHLVILGTPAGRLSCLPVRNARAVLAAYALAVAAAAGGRGRLVDYELGLAEAAGVTDGDPAAFVAATRLEPQERSLQEACYAWFRQFPHLEGRYQGL